MVRGGEQQSAAPGRVGVGEGFAGVGKALNTGIPYSEPVRRGAGDIGARVAPQLLKQANPLAPAFGAVADLIPGVDSEQATAETGRVAGEALVPTKVWEAALILLPAAKARSIPELLSAITLGDVDALKAVKRVAPNLADNEIIAAARRLAAEESGMAKIPGKGGIGGTGRTAQEIQQAFRP